MDSSHIEATALVMQQNIERNVLELRAAHVHFSKLGYPSLGDLACEHHAELHISGTQTRPTGGTTRQIHCTMLAHYVANLKLVELFELRKEPPKKLLPVSDPAIYFRRTSATLHGEDFSENMGCSCRIVVQVCQGEAGFLL